MTVTQTVTQDPDDVLTFTLQRGSVFWFNRRVPPLAGEQLKLAGRLRKVSGDGLLRFSLGTGDRREAARVAAVAIDDLLATRHLTTTNTLTPPTNAGLGDILAGPDELLNFTV